MSSKYDKYWLSKMNEIQKGIHDALNNKSSVIIDVDDIKAFGKRNSWYGIIELFHKGYSKGEMAHMLSLGKMIIRQPFYKKLFEDNDSFVTLKIKDSLKLEVNSGKNAKRKINRKFEKEKSSNKKHISAIKVNGKINNKLSNYGFIIVGRWELTDDLKSGVRPVFFDTELIKKRVLYSFIINGDVKYIGICEASKTNLISRMKRYQSQTGGSTNKRISEEIKKNLKSDDEVLIFACKPETKLNYNKIKIDLIKGLENELISEFKPKWNIQT